MSTPSFKVVLVSPEIPGNTGSIGRTTVALNLDLILIKPYGFDLSEKAVRRAGLDYWQHVRLYQFGSFKDFLESESTAQIRENLFFFSRFSKQVFYHAKFTTNSILIFGAETKGLSKSMLKEYSDRCYCLPTFSKHIRSLNLANTATAVIFEALRQTHFGNIRAW